MTATIEDCANTLRPAVGACPDEWQAPHVEALRLGLGEFVHIRELDQRERIEARRMCADGAPAQLVRLARLALCDRFGSPIPRHTLTAHDLERVGLAVARRCGWR